MTNLPIIKSVKFSGSVKDPKLLKESITQLLRIDCSPGSFSCSPLDWASCASAYVVTNEKDPPAEVVELPDLIYLLPPTNGVSDFFIKYPYYKIDGVIYMYFEEENVKWLERVSAIWFSIGSNGKVLLRKPFRMNSGKSFLIYKTGSRNPSTLVSFLQHRRKLQYNETTSTFSLSRRPEEPRVVSTIIREKRAPQFGSLTFTTVVSPHWAYQYQRNKLDNWHSNMRRQQIRQANRQKRGGRKYLSKNVRTLNDVLITVEDSKDFDLKKSIDRIKKGNFSPSSFLDYLIYEIVVDMEIKRKLRVENSKFTDSVDHATTTSSDITDNMTGTTPSLSENLRFGNRHYRYYSEQGTCKPYCEYTDYYYPHLSSCDEYYYCDNNFNAILGECESGSVFLYDEDGPRCAKDPGHLRTACETELVPCPVGDID